MKTNYLKNIFLVGSGIALATSFAIYAQPVQLGTSIHANLVNLVQYLESLHITSNGTPNGIQFIDIDGAQRTMSIQNDTLAFDFNSHNFAPFDYVGGLYNDGGGNVLLNGVGNPATPMAVMSAISSDGDRIGISTRKQNGEVTAMMEYESTGNQDQAVQVQHQVKLKADGTTISFDDYNVLGSQTQLGLGGYGFYITSSSGAYMAMTRDGTFSLANYTFPLANGSEGQVLTSHSNGQLSWEDGVAGGSSDIESIHVSVNSGQILSMFSSPIELLPAPGAGKVIEVINILVKKNFVSSPYAGDIYPGIIFSGAPSLFDNIAGLSIDFTSSQINTIPANGIVVENAPLLLHTSSSDPTGGDGSLDIYIHYRIVDL